MALHKQHNKVWLLVVKNPNTVNESKLKLMLSYNKKIQSAKYQKVRTTSAVNNLHSNALKIHTFNKGVYGSV